MTQEELKKHKKKQNIISAIILIVGIFLSIMIFGSDKSKSQNDASDQTVPVGETSVAKVVKTMMLKSGAENIAKLEKTVYLNSDSKANAVAEYSGRIKIINFNVGEEVREGEILAVFDQADNANLAKVSFESAQKSYELVEKNLKETKKITEETLDLADDAVDLAKIQLEQAKDGGDKDAIALAEESLDIAKTQEDQAEASAKAQINGAQIQLEQAKAGLVQAQIGYDKTFIKAPISGYIASKDVDADDYVNAGDVVAEIIGSSKLRAKIYLNADEIKRIKTGDLVEIYSGENKFSGKIESFSDIANNNNQRFEVQIEVADGMITDANQNIRVTLSLRILDDNVFYVPLDAVNIGQTKTEVFIKDGEMTKAVQVETGKIIGNQVEITKGLNSGDELIIEGNRSLTDGEKIEIESGV